MKGILIRIGIDSTKKYGGWNGPVDPESGEFIYVPLRARSETVDNYSEVKNYLNRFCDRHKVDLYYDLNFPSYLDYEYAHLDPDFKYLTYGDVGTRRGKKIQDLNEGDFIAFYGGLKPIKPCGHKTFYALMGLYVIDNWKWSLDISDEKYHENAHTRNLNIYENDVVVWGKPKISGRLKNCVPIGEWRSGSYRVRDDLLEEWGGLCIKNGYIQRSVNLPLFKEPERFYTWFLKQNPVLIQKNNLIY